MYSFHKIQEEEKAPVVLRVIVPFRVHFCMKLGAVNPYDEAYLDFWERVNEFSQNQNTSKVFSAIHFLHRKQQKGGFNLLYADAKSDTGLLPLHFIQTEGINAKAAPWAADLFERSIRDPQFFKNCHEERKALQLEDGRFVSFIERQIKPWLPSAILRIYDNTVGSLQMDFGLAPMKMPPEAQQDAYLSLLRKTVQLFGAELLRNLYPNHLFPLLSAIAGDRPENKGFVQTIGRYNTHRDLNDHINPENAFKPPLWTSYTLIFTEGLDSDSRNAMIQCWLSQISDPDEVKKVQSDPFHSLMSWGSNIIREGLVSKSRKGLVHSAASFEQAWEAMVISQYFYTAVYCLNETLNIILSHAYKGYRGTRIKDLYDSLNAAISTTKMLMIAYQDMQQYLVRVKFVVIVKIMEKWEFKTLVDNLEKKIDLGNRRLTEIHKKARDRSSLYTDFLLLGIAAIAIVDLFLSLAEYSRTLTSDAMVGFRDDSPLKVVQVIATLPTDLVVLFGLVIVFLISFFYLHFRKKQIL